MPFWLKLGLMVYKPASAIDKRAPISNHHFLVLFFNMTRFVLLFVLLVLLGSGSGAGAVRNQKQGKGGKGGGCAESHGRSTSSTGAASSSRPTTPEEVWRSSQEANPHAAPVRLERQPSLLKRPSPWWRCSVMTWWWWAEAYWRRCWRSGSSWKAKSAIMDNQTFNELLFTPSVDYTTSTSSNRLVAFVVVPGSYAMFVSLVESFPLTTCVSSMPGLWFKFTPFLLGSMSRSLTLSIFLACPLSSRTQLPCCAKSIHLWFFRDSICWALKAIAELRKSMPLFEALPHQLGIWSCLVPSPMLGCVIQNFIAFDSETAGVPCLIQVSIEDHLLPTPPPVAAALPLTCTVQDVVASINALWIFDVIGVSITVFDGNLDFWCWRPFPSSPWQLLHHPCACVWWGWNINTSDPAMQKTWVDLQRLRQTASRSW